MEEADDEIKKQNEKIDKYEGLLDEKISDERAKKYGASLEHATTSSKMAAVA